MPWDRKRLLGHVETIQLILGVTDKNDEQLQTKYIEPRHEISNNVVCATSKASDQRLSAVWSEPLLVAWI